MLRYEEVLAELFENRDEEYRTFHKKLLKNDAINVIGVRMPVLRKLAKQWKEEWETLLTFPDEYYEVTFLKCTAVSALPFPQFCTAVDGVVDLFDNWATCDCFAPRCVRKHREAFLPYLERYLQSEKEFTRRYALVALLHDYVEEEYLPVIFDFVRRCNGEEYYVMMAAAWLVAEVLVKYYDRGTAFLREECMPVQMHNKAIQKARESYRLSAEQKEALKGMKR